MKLTNATTNSSAQKTLTLEDLKKAADLIQSMEDKSRPKLHRPWLDRIMAKLGWHRKYEILVIDKQKFQYPLWHL